MATGCITWLHKYVIICNYVCHYYFAAGLAENVFLVVVGVVIVVIIYTAIMCLMLFLCCYCRKQDNKPPPYRQERNLYTPDPVSVKEERVSSSLSRASNGVKDVPGVTYYDLSHPFSRASSDARSHDTMELIGMGDNYNEVCWMC